MKQMLLIWLFCFCIFPQGYCNYFIHVDGKNDLSHNNVKTIIQDSYGFMWFGTRNRLNRYDGTSMKSFDCYDPVLQKRNNNVSSLFEDDERKLWIGTDKGVFIFNPINESFRFFEVEASGNETITEWVADIQQDQNQNIWIVVPNQGVFKFNTKAQKLKFYTVVNKVEPSKNNPQCISIEKNGRVWIGTNGQGVFLYNENDDSFSQYTGDNLNGESLLNRNIYTMCHINEELIIGVHESCLMKLDTRRNFAESIHIPQVDNKIIRDIVLLDNVLWVGTQNGITTIDIKTNKIHHIKEDLVNIYSLSDNIIEKIYKDREGGVWVGTNSGGVNYLPDSYNNFEKYRPNGDGLNSISKRIREIVEDPNGKIWLGTEDMGVVLFDPDKQDFKRMSSNNYRKTLAMLLRGQDIWVGYFKDGLDIINRETGAVRHYTAEMLGIDEESVFALCEDRYGKIWLGNAWGVFVADKDDMRFKRMDIFGLCYTHDIIEDSEGYIWVASLGSGVFQYNPQTGTMVHHTQQGDNSLSSNSVSSITEDHLGQIWFSTDRGGICKYNKKQKTYTTFTIKDGLPDDIAYKILEDRNYDLWFGTNRGLVCFNPFSNMVRVYRQSDGLLSEQFNYNSGLVSKLGKIYIGSMEGLIVFSPDEFKENHFVPPVYITRFSIFNKEVNSISSDSQLSESSIIHTDKIELKYNQSNISFDFVSLSYSSPLSNTYAYKMEGVDQDWVYTKNSHSASYTNLQPGVYTFRVKGSNNDGVWNEDGASVEIVISPPWWLTGIAIAIYILLAITIVYALWRWYFKRMEKDANEKRILQETAKDRELYETKVNFFTNIAHEIRTPTTLINGPLESLIEMDIKNEDIKYNLSIIERNTKHLLELINQILDFRKIEDSKFQAFFEDTNITRLLDNILIRFEKEINLKKRSLQIIRHQDNPIFASVDKEAVSKIITNLLSNAIKYSEKLIKIEIGGNDEYFELIISNDGDSIPEEFRDRIFDPFFQANSTKEHSSGTGIGLSLALSLVDMHHGTLLYDYVGDMNQFILMLPLHSEQPSAVAVSPDAISNLDDIDGEDSLNIDLYETILLVEDNKELAQFISNKLGSKYHIETAANGVEAQSILRQKAISVIISDIMMPEMNGLELCEYVKKSSEYNHIIVILLTAKNDLSSKIQGLEKGADAYVEKPFSFVYLDTLIRSLINNKIREHEIFLKKPFLSMQQSKLNKADEQFLNTIVETIEKNIADPDLNVERLAELMKLSRSSLHRKIKAMTDSTPIDFIRLVRMQKAAQIIQDGNYRINEICYLVGINSPSYFTKLFNTQYGVTPKEFEKQYRDNKG